MVDNWLFRLCRRLMGRDAQSVQAPADPASPTHQPPDSALDDYARALDALSEGDAQTLLSAFLARDAVAAAHGEATALSPPQAQRLLDLDARLRQAATRVPLAALPNWRQTLAPPASAWWWSLDQAVAKREEQRDLPWLLLSGTFTLLTAALTAEILARLWDGAPDAISVFGSLLTLALTGSPLSQRGREFGAWLVERLPRLQLKYRAEALAALTALAFFVVLAIRLALPALAVVYNNRGFAAQEDQNYARAQRKYQRAVALDPDHAVAAYNLAEIYRRTYEPGKAQDWYQHAIAADLNFAPAYRGLGRLHNERGEHAEAEATLQAGLTVVGESPTTKEEVIARYRLLANLGWAYYAQEQTTLARRALEDAIALEGQLKAFEEAEPQETQYRSALPHYYLAQLYEQADQPQKALVQWETCLALLKPGWSEKMAWRIEAQAHIEQLQEELP